MLIEGMSLEDGLYMTMITITTVGFGEVQPLSGMGRLFTIALLLLGVTAATNAISSAVGLVMGPRLWDSIRKMRMERHLAEEIKDHYIVCGYGRMGRQVTQDLVKRGEAFVLIDTREDLEPELLENNIPYVMGNATQDDVLRQAGIERARGLVTALDDDPDNIMTVLTARELNPSLFIVARVSRGESERKLLRAGADRVVSPYQIGGHRIALALIRPAVNDFLDSIFHFEHGLDIDIGELYLPEGTILVGKTVGTSGLRESHRVTILAINRPGGDIVLTPDIDMVLEADCTLIVIGPPERVYDLERTYPRPQR
jgi:voltage-gated potassium channel